MIRILTLAVALAWAGPALADAPWMCQELPAEDPVAALAATVAAGILAAGKYEYNPTTGEWLFLAQPSAGFSETPLAPAVLDLAVEIVQQSEEEVSTWP